MCVADIALLYSCCHFPSTGEAGKECAGRKENKLMDSLLNVIRAIIDMLPGRCKTINSTMLLLVPSLSVHFSPSTPCSSVSTASPSHSEQDQTYQQGRKGRAGCPEGHGTGQLKQESKQSKVN